MNEDPILVRPAPSTLVRIRPWPSTMRDYRAGVLTIWLNKESLEALKVTEIEEGDDWCQVSATVATKLGHNLTILLYSSYGTIDRRNSGGLLRTQ